MAQQKTRGDQVQPYEFSETAKPLAYEAAIRIMLNISPDDVIEELGIPEGDLKLIRLIYEAETTPDSPEVVAFGQTNLMKLRSSYLLARGECLWIAEYGTLSDREQEFLLRVVKMAVQDDDRQRFLSLLSEAADEDFEKFELQLSRLILVGQQRIMDCLKQSRNDAALLSLIALHEDVLRQQLSLIDSLENNHRATPSEDASLEDAESMWDEIDADNN
ncbi:MAG: hypothetical protein K2W95_31260 [Candidatus Obscuribacterales bacterium]|nr:hypothetical protein [Candidatus Obscuribacterales bacterium]